MTYTPVPSTTVPAEPVSRTAPRRFADRLRLVSAAAPLLLCGVLVTSTPAAALETSTVTIASAVSIASAAPIEGSWATGQEGDKKKKRKKQRGKVVRATVVPSAPATEAEPTAEAETATVAAPSASADPKAAKKAEKEARQRAKKEEAERERAAKEADRRRDDEKQAADRAARREAEQAQDKADAEASRQQSANRAAAKEAAREERAAQSAAKSEAKAQRDASAREARASEARASEAKEATRSVTAPVRSETTPAPKRDAAVVAPARPAPAKAAPATPTPAARTSTTNPAPATRAAAPSPDRRAAADISESIQVREVLLDVLVSDRKGNSIEGLDKSAFQVTEDGKPVEVTSLVYYGGAKELKSAGIEETRTDRYFILLFHDQAQAAPFLRAAQMDNGRWAQKWIENELQPNDQVAVLGYDVRLKVYQDFSTDPIILSQAVDAAVRGRNEPDRWRTREADPARDGSPSLLINLPKGQTLSRETRKLQEALELLGRASEGIIGRKNLMLFSAGFGDIDDIGVWTPDPRYYPPMKESLNTGNVAVYSIDILGSRRGTPGARDINDGLSALSTDTGGHYYSTFANVMAPLRNVADDNLGYYLLSYRSEFEAGTTGYREVKVKVDKTTTGKKLRVKARKGYRFGT